MLNQPRFPLSSIQEQFKYKTVADVISMKQPPLFEVYPDLREQVPWIPILSTPTPTRQLTNLQQVVNTNEEIWMKLDNLTSEKYGGNKVRKLEFLIADALQQEKHQIATLGGLGTNHGLATPSMDKQTI